MLKRINALKKTADRTGSVFLDSADGNVLHPTLLFSDPRQILTINSTADVIDLLNTIDAAVKNGYYLAGYFGYECGYGLDPFNEKQDYAEPIAWFGIYDAPEPVASAMDYAEDFAPYRISDLQLTPGLADYQKALAEIHELIAAGETYQINYTGKYRFRFSGDSRSFYQELRRRQPVSYAAFLNTGHRKILSLSPELFFRRDGGQITVRPMKGTARRGRFAAEDQKIAALLQADEKSRAENVMIVDLLRNDLSRICETGSVKTPKLFEVERYRSLFQMTSTVTGKLRSGIDYPDIFQALFPCGSVTGAPKIRSMEIIRSLEAAPRGVYTGAIGYISPQQKAVFSVPIRTIVLDGEAGQMGTGSGIVWDSDTAAEYRECQLKAHFLTGFEPQFQILETILWDGRFAFLDHHLQRMACSAAYFDYTFDREKAEAVLQEQVAAFDDSRHYRCRLLLSENDSLDCQVFQLPDGRQATKNTPLKVAFAKSPVDSADRFLFHKTTHRQRYDQATAIAREQKLADILFYNEKGQLTEGAISNVFIAKEGKLQTPPLECGLLPGIYRQYLLDSRDNTIETTISKDDLKKASAIYICNAVRGLQLVELSDDVVDV